MQQEISVNPEEGRLMLTVQKPRKSCLSISNYDFSQNTTIDSFNNYTSWISNEDTFDYLKQERSEKEWRFIPHRKDPVLTQFKFYSSLNKDHYTTTSFSGFALNSRKSSFI